MFYIFKPLYYQMTVLTELREIAQAVRKDFESGRIDEKVLQGLYEGYNPIIDVGLFVRRSRDLFPALNCGLASVYLRDVLGEGEVRQGSYNGENHTFLLIQGKTLVDITADQYGGPAVYVGPIKKPWRI